MEKSITRSSGNSQKIRWNVLNHIHTLLDSLVNSELEPRRTTLYQTTLQRLSEYFNINEAQTWIVCVAILNHFTTNCDIQLSDFANFVETSVLKIAEMNSDFVALKNRNIIDYSETDSSFKITGQVIKAVLNNEVFKPSERKRVTYLDFVAKAAHKYEGRKYTDDTCEQLVDQLKELEDKNADIPFIIRSRNFIQDDKSRFMFYDMCNDSLSGMPSCLASTIEDIYEDSEKYFIAKEFLDEKHLLITCGFFEFEKKGNLLEATLRITEKGKKFFLDEDYELYASKIDDKLLKKPESIKSKKLFYSPQNQKQVEDLYKILSQSKYKQITKRLEQQALPRGIAIMLHGAPGCGKTETVYQLAKKTGRCIVQVDISQTKSCWVGESEKLIKKVFTDYRDLCKKIEGQPNGRTPILLFNECDAVFTKRMNVSHSNTTQMENAMQNIILEEMEKLEGILIATTNLTDNLDPAFERRFLFKIRFENPSLEAKKAIWKNKMSYLSSSQIEKLSGTFNFSGGEIENIVRKAQMKEIISGERPAFSDILELCRNEKLVSNTERPMGFAV